MDKVLSVLEDFKKDFHEYAIGDTDLVQFQEGVAAMCRMNYCGMYGRTWMCPPGVGDYRKLEKQFRLYRRFFVFTTKHEIEDSFDIEGMGRGKDAHRLVQDKVQEALRGLPCRLLGAGGCGICAKCSYPDVPCRFPEKAVPSMEACGINVVELSRDMGIHYINGQNTVTYFSMVFFDPKT